MNTWPALDRFIGSSVLVRPEALHEKFLSARPFKHVVIDNFFQPAFCASLLEQFPSFDEKGAINENGVVGGKSTQERVRSLGQAFRNLDDVVQGQDFLSLIGHITGIEELRYDPYYFGGGTHENREGQDLDAHIDFNYHPITRQHRRLNLIVYLNEHWQDEWGGSLQLHQDPYKDPSLDEIITLTPLLNRCVIFATNEHSWHGFERIHLPPDQQHLSRKSFALYYYTDTRPEKETAEEHSTVYVERHLPARFRAGLTLNANDVEELRVLLARRDQHLKRLYRNIHRLYGELNHLKQQVLSGSVSGHLQAAAEKIMHPLSKRVYELEHSTSWRITAPLRALKRFITGRG